MCVWRFTMRCMLSIRWWMSMRCLSLRGFFLSLHRLFLIVCYLAILSTNEMISNDNHEMLWFILWCFSHIFIALERFFHCSNGCFSSVVVASFFFFSSYSLVFVVFVCMCLCAAICLKHIFQRIDIFACKNTLLDDRCLFYLKLSGCFFFCSIQKCFLSLAQSHCSTHTLGSKYVCITA